jgi:hypothetical protein
MYKKQGKFKIPEYSQVGVLVEGPTEFFNGRIQKKDRKKTFVDDALATESKTGRFKMKYGEVQKSKTSGKKAFYKALKARRKSGGKGWRVVAWELRAHRKSASVAVQNCSQ